MSRQIDERVVQMTLESEDFQRSANQAIDTIDQMNRSLDGLEDRDMGKVRGALRTATDHVRGFAAVVQEQTHKLTTMQIAGITSIQNITNSMINTLKHTLKSFTLDDVMSGFSKYGEKTRSVGTLVSQGYDLSVINDEVDRLRLFADETSYSLLQMTDTIGKFTATGMELSDARQAVQGIALWAATAGQNASTASRAMIQLAQGIPSGRIRYEDWRSIMTYNMDTASFHEAAANAAVAKNILTDLGDGMYEIKENGKQFNLAQLFSSDGLTGGEWFTTDVFLETMKTYNNGMDTLYNKMQEFNTGKSTDEMITFTDAIDMFGDEIDEFGLNAVKSAQEARTLEDAIEATKDAVSSQWMAVYEKIFGDYDKAKELWTDLSGWWYDIFAAPLEKFNFVLDEWNKGWGDWGSGRDLLIEGFWDLVDALGWLIAPIKQFWSAMFPPTSGKKLYEFTLKFRTFAASLKEFLEPIEEKMKRLKEEAEKVTKPVEDTIEVIAELDEIANRVISGEFGNGETRFKALEDLGFSWKMVQNRVNEMLGSNYRYELSEEEVAAATQKTAEAQAEQEKKVTRLEQANKELAQARSDLITLENEYRHGVGAGSELTSDEYKEQHEALKKKVGALEDEIETTEHLMDVEEKAKARFDNLAKIITGVRNVLQFFADVWQKLWDTLRDETGWFYNNVVVSIGDRILGLIAGIVDHISNATNSVREFFDTGRGKEWVDMLKGAWDTFSKFDSWISDKVNTLYESVLAPVGKFAMDQLGKLPQLFSKIGGGVTRNQPKFKKLGDTISGLWETIKQFFGEKFSGLLSLLDGFFQKMGGEDGFAWVDWVIDKLGQGSEWLAGALGWLLEHTGTIQEFFGIFTSDLGGRIEGIFGNFVNASNTDEMQQVVRSMGEASDAITETKSLFEKFGEKMTPIIDFMARPFAKVQEALGKLGESMVDTFTEEKIDKWWKRLEKVGILAILGHFAKGFSSIGSGLKDAFKAIALIPTWANEALKSYKRSFDANTFKQLATGIVLIAGAMYLLSWIPADDLVNVTSSVAAIMICLSVLIKAWTALKKIGEGKPELDAAKKAAEQVANAQNNFFNLLKGGIFDPIKNFIDKTIPARIDKWLDLKFRKDTLLAIAAFIAAIAGITFGIYKLIDSTKDSEAARTALIWAAGVTVGLVLAVFFLLNRLQKASEKAKAAGGWTILASMISLIILFKAIKDMFQALWDTITPILDIIVNGTNLTGAERRAEMMKRVFLVVERVLTGLAGFYLVIYALGKVTKIMRELPRYTTMSGTQYLTFAIAVLAMAGAIGIIVKAAISIMKATAKLQNKYPDQNMLYTLVASLIGIIGILAMMTYVLKNAGQFDAVFKPILAMAAALYLFGRIIIGMSGMVDQINKVLPTFTNMLTGIFAVVALIAVFDWLSKGESAKFLTRTAFVIAAVAGALMLLASSFVMIGAAIVAMRDAFAPTRAAGGFDFNNFVSILVIAGGLVTLFGVLDHFAGGKITLTFIKLGAALVVFGAGLFMVGKGIAAFVTGIADMGKAIIERGEEIKTAIMTLLGIIGSVFAGWFVKSKTTLIPLVVGFVKSIGGKLLATLAGFSLPVGLILVAVALAAIGALSAYAPDLIQKIGDFILNTIIGLTKWINENALPLAAAIMDLLDSIWDLIIDALGRFAEKSFIGRGIHKLEDLNIPVVSQLAGYIDGFGNMIASGAKMIYDSDEQFEKHVDEAEYNLGRAADTLWNSFDGKGDAYTRAVMTADQQAAQRRYEDYMNEQQHHTTPHASGKFGEDHAIVGKSAPTKFSFTPQKGSVEVVVEDVEDVATFTLTEPEKVEESAKQSLFGKIKDTLLGGGSTIDIQGTLESMGITLPVDVVTNFQAGNLTDFDLMSTLSEQGIDIGETLPEYIAQGVTSEESIDLLNQATGSAVSDSVDAAVAVADEESPRIADHYTAGFIKRMIYRSKDARIAAQQFAGAVNAGLEYTFQIASPSKVTAGYGDYYADGFIFRVGNRMQDAVNAGNRFGASAINGLLYAVNNPDAMPTIRPVFDGGSVSNGLRSLESMLYKRNMSLSTDVGDLDGMNQRLLTQLQAVQLSNETATNEIIKMRQDMLAMRGDITLLGNRISGMSVRLDGKSVVGGIIEDVDKQLGQRASRRLK